MLTRSKSYRCTALHTLLQVCILCHHLLRVQYAAVDHLPIVSLWVKVVWQRCMMYVVKLQFCHCMIWKSWPRITQMYKLNKIRRAIPDWTKKGMMSLVTNAMLIVIIVNRQILCVKQMIKVIIMLVTAIIVARWFQVGWQVWMV